MEPITNNCITENGRFTKVYVDFLRITGNMNNIIFSVEIKVDVLNDGEGIDKGRLISFSYDYRIDESGRLDICYDFHDEDMNFYNSDDFSLEDLNEIKKKLKEIIYPKLLHDISNA
jgi:hypothetical protein